MQQLHDDSVSWYVNHLMAIAHAAATLDHVRPLAERGDIEGLMVSDEVGKAMAALATPLDVLTLQRDLNMLGARPALAETGTMDKATTEAIRSLQQRFGQVPTGKLDSDARIALTYGVGKIYARDASALCGIRMGW
jgi:peptidoglycan hydrolase-like protein with peptidoglycan-binding domain